MGTKRAGSNGKGIVLPEDWVDEFWERDTKMEDILTRKGFEFDYVYYDAKYMPSVTPYNARQNLMAATRGPAQASQLQVRAHTDENVVAAYESALRRNEKLPATTWDKLMQGIDTHHRHLSAVNVGLDHFVVLRVRDTLDEVTRQYLASLRNSQHGHRQTYDEMMAAGLRMVLEKGLLIDAVASELGVSASSLRRAVDDRNAHERAAQLGVEAEFARQKKGVRQELSSLHDEQFKSLTRLFALTSPAGSKAVEIVKEVKGQTSDKKANEVIKRVREVDLAPQAAVRGNTAKAGITAGPLAVGEAYRLGGPALTGFVTMISNRRITEAFMACSPTDPKFSKIHAALNKVKPTLDKLYVHFGV